MARHSFPQRKSPRLQGYDYSAEGAYFITICTHQRQHLFGEIAEGVMSLTPAGNIALERWYALPEHHHGIELDAFVIMPNHVHGIIVVSSATPDNRRDEACLVSLADNAGTPDNAGVVPTLGTIIGSYKSGVTRRIREALALDDFTVWQGRYHDHIIRDEQGLNNIRRYIQNNVALWDQDTFFTQW